MIRSRENSLGAWAFLAGVILAVVIGLSTSKFMAITFLNNHISAVYAILLIIGLVIGFVNVTGKDSQTFMIAGAVLVVVSKFGMDNITGSIIGIGVGETISSVFRSLSALFVPATIVVALKTVFSISRV